MGKELELKFSATPEMQQMLRREQSGGETVYEMQTTYYDTSDGQLSRRRCTLRCRLENRYPVCTFKTPVSDTERGEFDVQGVLLPEAVRPLAEESGAGYLLELADRLTAVCGARFQRIAKVIDHPDFSAELALDEGVLLGGGREIPLCEIELEYKTGDEDRFLAYAAEFAARYSLQPEKLSKFARAAALAKGE